MRRFHRLHALADNLGRPLQCLQLGMLALTALLAPLPAAAQQTTEWKSVDRPLSALLDDGWRIESMNYNQVMEREFHTASNAVNGFQAWALAAVPKGLEYNFLLSKAGKWVVCIVIDPSVVGTKSRCRALN